MSLMWLVQLKGIQPPTLGSVGTFHIEQLGDLLENIAQIAWKIFTQVRGRST